jgi:TAG lipase/lysophosphatidylethanolamine acyltransferase
MLKQLYAWWTKKSTRDVLLETLAEAKDYDEWEITATELDTVMGYDLWYEVRILSFVS